MQTKLVMMKESILHNNYRSMNNFILPHACSSIKALFCPLTSSKFILASLCHNDPANTRHDWPVALSLSVLLQK